MNKFYDALYSLAKTLDENDIEYMLSGSMAGKFYGLKREPHDLDIYIFEKSLPKINHLFSQYITKPLYHCLDDFYDEYILELEYMGVKVELCIVDKGAIHSLLTDETISTMKFYKTQDRKLRDATIKVQALAALIDYKHHNTNQEFAKNQIEDVEELLKIQHQTKK